MHETGRAYRGAECAGGRGGVAVDLSLPELLLVPACAVSRTSGLRGLLQLVLAQEERLPSSIKRENIYCTIFWSDGRTGGRTEDRPEVFVVATNNQLWEGTGKGNVFLGMVFLWASV